MTPREIARAYVENIEIKDDHYIEVMVAITKEYGDEGFREVGKELSKEYEEREEY